MVRVHKLIEIMPRQMFAVVKAKVSSRNIRGVTFFFFGRAAYGHIVFAFDWPLNVNYNVCLYV